MTDKELLELAAKAAGIEINWFKWERLTGQWNPLVDDGDALRLAVKLKLLSPELDPRIAIAPLDSEYPYAATRRAITRAAAEIGKAMP